MKAKLDKTNAMRKLDAMKISYREHTYTDTDAISGVEVGAVGHPNEAAHRRFAEALIPEITALMGWE